MKRIRIGTILLMTLFLLAGCASDAAPGGAESKKNIVEVTNVNELINAIAPDTEIHLAPGRYVLSRAESYGSSSQSSNSVTRYCRWDSGWSWDEYTLCITGVDGLTITGRGAEILTEPRSADVLRFEWCSGVTLSGLSIGHTEAANPCEGGVLTLKGCSGFQVEECSLFGCGTVGVQSEKCSAISLTDTNIHHCSVAAVESNSDTDYRMSSCRVYDCGDSSPYGGAFLLHGFYGTEKIRISDCEICGCTADGVFCGEGVGDALIERVYVHDNHLASVAEGTGELAVTELRFENNCFDGWFRGAEYGAGYESGFTWDGKVCSEEELRDRYASQLSSAGVGTVETVPQIIDRCGTKEIHVSTPDAFLRAIGSDTTVIIDVPCIRLTDCSDYGENAAERWEEPDFSGKSYCWRTVFDGFELCIGEVENFHIVGGELVTEPRYANVLNLIGCRNVSLENVKLGHTPEEGECSGGVVNLLNCSALILECCDLYGCGTLGLEGQNVLGLSVQNTRIHDCNQGAGVFYDSDTVSFLGCTVENCPEPHFALVNCEGFSWEQTLMDPNSRFNVGE